MNQKIEHFFRNLKARDLLFLAILGIGLVILVIQVGRRQFFQPHAAGGNATIVLTPSTNNPVTIANPGNFNVAVSLNPNGESLVGADVALTFNQQVLAVNSITIPTTFAAGQNLQAYAPTNSNGTFNSTSVISTANSTGTLSMGAVAFNWAANAVTPAQTLAVPFATINFRAVALGTTNITVKFTSGSTTDSNLVSITSGAPADVISDTTATALASTLPVTVSGPATITPTPTSPAATPTRTPTPVPPTSTPTRTPTPVPPTSTPTRTPTPIPPTGTPGSPTSTPVPTATPTAGGPTNTPTPPSGSPTPAPSQGDGNGDGHVDGLDYIAWLNGYLQFNSTQTNLGPAVGDYNSSGFVDGLDYIIWRNNYGR